MMFNATVNNISVI